MRVVLFAMVFWGTQFGAVLGQKMTYEEAKRTLPKQSLPAFWIAEPAVLAARWQNLKHGKVEVIAQSPGGRPLHLITYGVREDQKSEANFNSAIAGRKPSAYRDREKRTRPVLFLVGPVHGQETEGLVGLVNLIHILETGSDLRSVPNRPCAAWESTADC